MDHSFYYERGEACVHYKYHLPLKDIDAIYNTY